MIIRWCAACGARNDHGKPKNNHGSRVTTRLRRLTARASSGHRNGRVGSRFSSTRGLPVCPALLDPSGPVPVVVTGSSASYTVCEQLQEQASPGSRSPPFSEACRATRWVIVNDAGPGHPPGVMRAVNWLDIIAGDDRRRPTACRVPARRLALGAGIALLPCLRIEGRPDGRYR
jgi:hypothetical protein